MDGWVGGWMDGWMSEWMDVYRDIVLTEKRTKERSRVRAGKREVIQPFLVITSNHQLVLIINLIINQINKFK